MLPSRGPSLQQHWHRHPDGADWQIWKSQMEKVLEEPDGKSAAHGGTGTHLSISLCACSGHFPGLPDDHLDCWEWLLGYTST